MKNLSNYIYLIIPFILLVLFFYYKNINNLDLKIEKHKVHIERNQLEINKLNNNITTSYTTLDSLKNELSKINVKVDGVVIEKQIIKQDYENKIILIDNFSYSELDSFFTNRLSKNSSH